MQIIYQNKLDKLLPCVATVGFFDGVHAGHRFLMEELKALAKVRNCQSVVVTFATHPRKVLNTDFRPDILTSLPEKLIQLETTGIDVCVVLSFSVEMAQLSAYDFLKTVLLEKLNVHTLLVGHDHRFGHNRTDGFPEYQHYGNQLGMEVVRAVQYKTVADQHISSSKIRLALRNGEIQQANRMLTYPYLLHGKVIDGFKNGRKMGFPTANLNIEDPDKLIPVFGVYAVRVRWNGQVYNGMMNIGQRPTLGNGMKTSIEVHIIDFNRDIYNQLLDVEVIQKIRNEQKFKSLELLIDQLEKDKQEIMSLL